MVVVIRLANGYEEWGCVMSIVNGCGMRREKEAEIPETIMLF